MTLVSSGQLSFNDIQIELGRTNGQNNFSINSAEAGTYGAINTGNPVNDRPDGASPNTVSEWYAYNHSYVVCFDHSLRFGATSVAACAAGGATYDSNVAALVVGSVIYNNATACVTTAAVGYYATDDATTWYSFDGGSIDGSGVC